MLELARDIFCVLGILYVGYWFTTTGHPWIGAFAFVLDGALAMVFLLMYCIKLDAFGSPPPDELFDDDDDA